MLVVVLVEKRLQILFTVFRLQILNYVLSENFKVPEAHGWLIRILVPPFIIRVIADVILIEMFHKAVWSIVYRHSENREIVCVQDTMTEAYRLPEGNHFGSPLGEDVQHFTSSLYQVGSLYLLIKVTDDIFQHLWHHLRLESGRWTCTISFRVLFRKDLERSESHESGCHPHNHSTLLIDRISVVKLVSLHFSFIAYNQ